MCDNVIFSTLEYLWLKMNETISTKTKILCLSHTVNIKRYLLHIPRLNIGVDIESFMLNNRCSFFRLKSLLLLFFSLSHGNQPCDSDWTFFLFPPLSLSLFLCFDHSLLLLFFPLFSTLHIWSVYVYRHLKCTRACHYFTHFCSFILYGSMCKTKS